MELLILELIDIPPEYDLPNPVGEDRSWNESYYFFWSDTEAGLAGFSRIGVRTNLGYVEGLHGVFLGGTRIGFFHERRPIDEGGDGLFAGPLSFECIEPMKQWKLKYVGEIDDIADGRVLETPRKDRPEGWRKTSQLDMELSFEGFGTATMFKIHDNQEHLEHHGRISGHLMIDNIKREVSGFCFRDKGIGPRNWKPIRQGAARQDGLPNTFIKWLEAPFGPEFSFSAILNVEDDGFHRGEGLAVVHGENVVMRQLSATSSYLPGSVLHDTVTLTGLVGDKPFSVEGKVISHIPTKIPLPDSVILVTEGLVRWTLPDGRQTLGIAEFHVATDRG